RRRVVANVHLDGRLGTAEALQHVHDGRGNLKVVGRADERRDDVAALPEYAITFLGEKHLEAVVLQAYVPRDAMHRATSIVARAHGEGHDANGPRVDPLTRMHAEREVAGPPHHAVNDLGEEASRDPFIRTGERVRIDTGGAQHLEFRAEILNDPEKGPQHAD